jgi:hypothetical protein
MTEEAKFGERFRLPRTRIEKKNEERTLIPDVFMLYEIVIMAVPMGIGNFIVFMMALISMNDGNTCTFESDDPQYPGTIYSIGTIMAVGAGFQNFFSWIAYFIIFVIIF